MVVGNNANLANTNSAVTENKNVNLVEEHNISDHFRYCYVIYFNHAVESTKNHPMEILFKLRAVVI